MYAMRRLYKRKTDFYCYNCSAHLISNQIGAYELALKDFHDVRFVIRNAKSISLAEKTKNGIEHFLITKFLSLGTNIKFKRVYDGSKNVILEMKIKPAITVGIGRKYAQGHMVSLMFCDDQVRINHHQAIDRNGVVSYSLRNKPKMDEKHNVELKIDSNQRVVFISLHWNEMWSANIAISNKAVTVGAYHTEK